MLDEELLSKVMGQRIRWANNKAEFKFLVPASNNYNFSQHLSFKQWGMGYIRTNKSIARN